MVTGFFGRTASTDCPFVSMGGITMKMINSTSITSTIGVTLMSATGGGTFFFSLYPTPYGPVEVRCVRIHINVLRI
jgi:hypothetical protein